MGTAGSGKTSLSSMLHTYLINHQLDAIVVNLDPAVEDLPYNPDVDVRDYVDARDIMAKTGLGPNGALIASIDLLLTNIEEIREEIWDYRANYIIIDTPGQMELFAFRETGPLVLKALIGDTRSTILFLIDSIYATKASNLFSALLLSASTHVRLNLPLLQVLTKIDLLDPVQLEEVLNRLEDPEQFSLNVINEKESRLIWDSKEVTSILEKLLSFDVIPVSNVTGDGFDNLYAAIQRIVAGGEDYYTEEPNPIL